MTKVGLLHTVPALADTFDELLAGSGAETVHRSDPTLLSRAIANGVDDEVRADVLRGIRTLVAQGVDAILVTCSSIGEAVEAAASQVDVPVLRVDAPMARAAVAEASRVAGERPARIAVLATLEATLGPTGRLLDRAVTEAHADAAVTATIVEGAAAARADGDQHKHDELVREAVLRAARSADAVVLAQASMAAAVTGENVQAAVFTSPEGGAKALIQTISGETS